MKIMEQDDLSKKGDEVSKNFIMFGRFSRGLVGLAGLAALAHFRRPDVNLTIL